MPKKTVKKLDPQDQQRGLMLAVIANFDRSALVMDRCPKPLWKALVDLEETCGWVILEHVSPGRFVPRLSDSGRAALERFEQHGTLPPLVA